ncbi:glutathione reductase [Ventosimonas gracilis]|uniref:Glutathione reductase n=1 Tax=Ventosimonas gracilis TaxID=1680762 RepID=A0A139SHY8_9GAMM|nr:glutathione-disulfide reductase [Ventosimonas gracilis]KXU34104.1 glutathione reductase [Ventosimonas gracilis]
MAFDFDLLVIGGGSGGVRAARFAADFGAKVALAESRYLGGTCVNVGCIPKKLFAYAAQFAEDFAKADGYGFSQARPEFNWQLLRDNKTQEIHRLNGVYRKLLENSGVALLDGHARLLDAHQAAINGKTYSAKNILLATGGWPDKPQILGIEHAITSNEVFALPSLPKQMLIVGGGYIAVEFASIFHALGVQVTLLYRGELFLRGFDGSLRRHLKEEFERKGLSLQFSAQITQIERQTNGQLTATLNDGRKLHADCIVYATGRRPMTDHLGLENTDVHLDQRGFVQVDHQYRTAAPSIFAIGDLIGRVQLTPVALAEGMAVAKYLFRPEQFVPLEYQLIPSAVFSLPNLASVGLSEEQAREQGHNVRLFESRFRALKLTMTDCQERTLCKLIVDADSDKVLGCHMAGSDAGEIIQGLAVALKAGASKQQFDQTLGIHPTAAEEFVTMRRAVGE